MPSLGNTQGSVPPDPYTNHTNSEYAIWTGNGGYFAGAFGGGADFRDDPMMAEKFNTEFEAKEAAGRIGLDDFEVRRIC